MTRPTLFPCLKVTPALMRVVVLCGSLLIPMLAHADDVPDGFAKGVTGGGTVAAVHPASLDELKNLLCASYDYFGNCTDDTPRVIALDHVYDFRGSVLHNGSAQTVESGCMVNVCKKGGGQWALNGANNFCQSRPPVQVTYDNAGLERLKVGSNKTLIGEGDQGGIQGMGLYIGGGAHNVIVRNLSLSDINARVVWGGDALTIDGADGVWIDHNRFALIGRQMIVTGWGTAAHVTISNNEFDGRTDYSASCDGHHYWVWLFLGHHDTLTVARNYVHDTSGRGPHSGGMGEAEIFAHVVNNVFSNLTYQGAIMSRTDTSHLFVEGNVFDHVAHPLFNYPVQPGTAFAPFSPLSPSVNSTCQRIIGRPCAANQAQVSGNDYRPQDTAALEAFQPYLDYLITPLSADVAMTLVPSEAGVGKIGNTPHPN